MSIKIVTLIENSLGEHKGLISEHGLSFYVEKDGRRILFDTGQSGAFLKNAFQLGLDPTMVSHVVVSHGHYDHSGGVRSLAELTTDFTLVVGTGFFDAKYGENEKSLEFLGNNFDETFLAENGISCQIVSEDIAELVPGIWVVTNFPRIHEDEGINPRFTLYKGGDFVQDTFSDEVLLALDSPNGLVILLGCSHPGVKNMIEFATKRLARPIHAILGGTHLVEADAQNMDRSLDYLQKDELKVIGVSHCTGKDAMSRLADTNRTYYHNRTGSSLFL